MMRAVGSNVFVSPAQIVEKSVYLAHADKARRVSVAGPDSLAAMIELCREGFEQVECARQATCACADEASDVLLIAGLMPMDDLTTLVQRTCRLLGDSGVLVVQLRTPGEDAAVRATLEAQGMSITSTLVDVSAGCLVTHTLERAAAPRQGASQPDDWRTLQARWGPSR
jgi:hypothetical protein